jgi:hypothetical protein
MKNLIACVVGVVAGSLVGWLVPLHNRLPQPSGNFATAVRAANEENAHQSADYQLAIQSIAEFLEDSSDWRRTLDGWRIVESMPLDQLKAAAESLLESGKQKPVLTLLMKRWAILAPEQFLEQFCSFDGRNRSVRRGVYQAFHHLADQDIDRAIERFHTLKSPSDHATSKGAITDVLARRNPLRLIEFAKNTGSYRRQLEELAFHNAARSNPDLLVEMLEKALYRKQADEALLRSLAMKEPFAAIRWLKDHGGGGGVSVEEGVALVALQD